MKETDNISIKQEGESRKGKNKGRNTYGKETLLNPKRYRTTQTGKWLPKNGDISKCQNY